jgi:hypothetical protein
MSSDKPAKPLVHFEDRVMHAPATKTSTAERVSRSNLSRADDGHLHHPMYTNIDNDHFKTAWTLPNDQKDGFTEDATNARKK